MVRIVRQRGPWCFLKVNNASALPLKRAFPDFGVESDGTVCVRLASDDDVARLEQLMT